MDRFVQLDGLVAPLDRNNVDTDAIIPKQFLKSIQRAGFGPNCFDEWRYMDHGEPGMDNSKRPLNPNFVLNQDHYRGAQILITRANFGCGSSREHAPLALAEAGVQAVVAPFYARIFFRNAVNGGYLIPLEFADGVAHTIRTGDEVEIRLKENVLIECKTGTRRTLNPIGDIAPIVEAGGVFEYAKRSGML